jgi:hypothetical protein
MALLKLFASLRLLYSFHCRQCSIERQTSGSGWLLRGPFRIGLRAVDPASVLVGAE